MHECTHQGFKGNKDKGKFVNFANRITEEGYHNSQAHGKSKACVVKQFKKARVFKVQRKDARRNKCKVRVKQVKRRKIVLRRKRKCRWERRSTIKQRKRRKLRDTSWRDRQMKTRRRIP